MCVEASHKEGDEKKKRMEVKRAKAAEAPGWR